MALTSCPDCKGAVSDAAAACIHCGRPMGGVATAPHPSADPDATTFAPLTPPPAAAAGPATQSVAEYPFFPVATTKFVVLSVCTVGLYDLYWSYRNWQRIAKRTTTPISPFWRAFFAALWSYELFKAIRTEAAQRGILADWSPGLLAVLFFALTASWRLPGAWWFIGFLSFAPMVPVAQTIEALNEAVIAAESPNRAYTGANILIIVLGTIFVSLAVIGTFLG